MSKLNVKSMKKSTLDHLITFAMVIVAYLIVQILIAAGVLSSLMQGLLVPMCTCLLYTSPSPRDGLLSRMPSSA